MASKLNPKLFLILPAFMLLILYSTFLPLYTPSSPSSSHSHYSKPQLSISSSCNLFKGKWVFDPTRMPMYDDNCPFHRNAWNCLRNQRENMGRINSWRWVPEGCELGRVDPSGFLGLMRNRNIGFVGDSLNENFLVSFLCILRAADKGAKKWKRKGAWRGAFFPKFNVTVGYHRAVLLAEYVQTREPGSSTEDGLKGAYRVDVDVPADDWAHIAGFYDVLVFNTGHWWGYDKFPKETPLVFYKSGQPIQPPLEMLDGFKVVLDNMVAHIEKQFPKTLKFWRLQSPRHFHGGEWNQNGSCVFSEPLDESQAYYESQIELCETATPMEGSILIPKQLDLWFDPRNNGVNKEARKLNGVIKEAIEGSSIRILDLTHLSEFRADAHPAIWLGKKDAVAVWGQDCMHWCLPGVPDTWVDILAQQIRYSVETG